MRGLILTNLYPSPDSPTRATFNYQQFEYLSEHIELLIIVPIFPNKWKSLPKSTFNLSKNNKVLYIPTPTIPILGKYLNAYIIYFSILFKKYSYIKLFSPNFILGCFAYPDGVAANMLARKLNLPYFIKVHGTDINVMAKMYPIKKQIVKAFHSTHGIFSVSSALANSVASLGYPKDKISVIYNGVDESIFFPTDKVIARKDLKLDLDKPLILFIGNILEEKGAIDLANAFMNIKFNASLIYIGNGSAIKRIKLIAAKLKDGLSISIVEPQHHSKISKWLNACDLLALPSHNEGVPNVILEAMACGRPCVATRVGGIPEVVTPDTGILVAPKNIDELTNALEKGLKTEWSSQLISSEAKKYDWALNASQMSKRLSDVIYNVIKN